MTASTRTVALVAQKADSFLNKKQTLFLIKNRICFMIKSKHLFSQRQILCVFKKKESLLLEQPTQTVLVLAVLSPHSCAVKTIFLAPYMGPPPLEEGDQY